MTSPGVADVTVVTAPAATAEHHSYVDWPAIVAGVLLASAISILLLTFGSAVGLNFTNFDARPDVNPIWVAIAAASWLLWVMISAFMAGGYVTGRLRRRFHDATADESDVRDGAHGLLVWAGGLVLGGVLAAAGVGALANVVGSTAATATIAASNVAGGAAEGAVDELADPNAYVIDTLFRAAPAGDTAAAPTADATEAAPAAEPAAPATEATAATTTETPAAPVTEPAPAATATDAASASIGIAPVNDPANDEAVRAEAGRIFAANTVTGEFNADDRAYLAQVVASETGLPQAEAEARVDQAITAVETARDEAAAAAETARKTAVLAAFLVAASLLVSAIGAYWAAQKGGQHRDEGTAFADVFRRW
jgi:hypothetical protein